MIEIPGYRILRELGRGGMATVYLAMQESVEREVALKVMSPALLVDPNFGDRFLREARIAAKLHHRHVVGVHDVGRVGDFHYIAMEFVAGGAVMGKEGKARPPTFSLRVTREIAMALHYAHAKGFVHRDVKPDNILLRDDGSSALTDFGIARASDSATRMTRTGAVIGTPHYMSPEQARGRPIDGRADLYSLGIVLHELLFGRVPYHAEDSLAVGIMHITEPLPVLPPRLRAIQPLMDKLLAKLPEDRFQTGQEVADAVEQIEVTIARGELPQLAVPDEAYRREILGADTPRTPTSANVARTRTSPVASMAPARNRAEPSLGRMDEVVAAAARRLPYGAAARDARGEGGSRRWIVLAIVVVLLLGGAAAAWRYQDRLRKLIPSTELNDLVTRGERALADGKLVGSQGDSARELFQAARALDGDNDLARQGLNKVGQRLIDHARVALSRSDFATAHSDLNAAAEVLGGGAEVEQLRTDLHSSEIRNTATEDLLKRAEAALASGQLLGDGSAAALYQRVLDADATNSLALNGLKKLSEAVAQQARDAIGAGNAELARQRIDDLVKLSPNHPAIPELRAVIAKAHESDSQIVEQQLARGEAQLRAGRFSGGDDSALVLLQAALRRDPNNARARSGLRKVAQALIVQANAALDDSNTGNADKLLQQAETLAPDAADLRAARSRLRETREQHEIATRQVQVSTGDQTHIQELLEEADKALAAGSLIIPPGDSAFDKFRAVLRIDGNNAQAFAGLNRIPARAKELFEQAIKDNTPNKARSYIDAIAQTNPGDAAVPALRERLANAFLDQADARIGEGRRVDATRAINSARELSPGNPRLSGIEQKLQEMPQGG